MQVRWIPAPRLPRLPLAATLVLGAWLVLVSASAVLEASVHREPVTCLFRWATGHPCPTCGSTRLVLHMLRGRLGAALLENPLVFIGLVGGGGLLAVRLILARKLRLDVPPGGRMLGMAVGSLLLIANWLWVLHRS